MTDDLEELDARIRAHFTRPDIAARTRDDLVTALRDAARRATEPPPVATVSAPEFHHEPGTGPITARFPCPRACGWWHEEPTDPGPSPLIVAIEPGCDNIGEMINLNAEARALALRARVENAVARHYAEAH